MNENDSIREENGTADTAAADAVAVPVSTDNATPTHDVIAHDAGNTEGVTPTENTADTAPVTDTESVAAPAAESSEGETSAEVQPPVISEDKAKLVIEAAIAEARAREAEAERERSEGARSFESNSFVSYVDNKKAYKGYDRVESDGKKKSDLSILSWTFFILAFLAGFAALVVLIAAAISKMNLTGVIILMSLICVANIVVGFIVLKRGVHGFKNLLVGVIGTLCFFLLATVANSASDGDSNLNLGDILLGDGDETNVIEVIEDIGLKTDFYLPENYDDFYDYSSSSKKDITLYYEDEKSVNDLLSAMSAHGKFVNKLPTSLIGCLPNGERTYDDDRYYLIYNEGTARFNTLPMASGNYDMIAVIVEFYSDDDATVWAYEYSITFISEHDSIIAIPKKEDNYA